MPSRRSRKSRRSARRSRHASRRHRVRGGSKSRSRSASKSRTASRTRTASRSKHSRSRSSRRSSASTCLGYWRFEPLRMDTIKYPSQPRWGCGKTCRRCSERRVLTSDCQRELKKQIRLNVKAFHRGDKFNTYNDAISAAYKQVPNKCDKVVLQM